MDAANITSLRISFFRSIKCKEREGKHPFVKVSLNFISSLGGLDSWRVFTNDDESKSKDF